MAALALCVVGLIWWRALEPSKIERTEIHDPVVRHVGVKDPADSLAWYEYTIDFKNGDQAIVMATHYIRNEDGTLVLKRADQNDIVFSTSWEQVRGISKKWIRIGNQSPDAVLRP